MKTLRSLTVSAFIAGAAFFSGAASAANSTYVTVIPAGLTFSVSQAGNYSFDSLVAAFSVTSALYQGTGTSGTLLQLDSGVAHSSFNAYLSTSTNYTYLVASLLPSTTIGIVSISGPGSVLAAVPEPETYAMLLAGLGLLAFALHKSRSGGARASVPRQDFAVC